MSAVVAGTRAKLSLERFQSMIEAGILRDDERIELIEGELLNMAPIGAPHACAVTQLSAFFMKALADSVHVWTQLPIVLPDWSQPQPGITLIRKKPGGYAQALPGPEDVLLLIEVSDSSLAYDRGTKLPLYGKHNISETWIVDLQARFIEVYRQPGPNGYERKLEFRGADPVAPGAFPNAKVTAAEVFSVS